MPSPGIESHTIAVRQPIAGDPGRRRSMARTVHRWLTALAVAAIGVAACGDETGDRRTNGHG